MGIAFEMFGFDVVEFGSLVMAALILAPVEASGPALAGYALADMEFGSVLAVPVFGLVEI